MGVAPAYEMWIVLHMLLSGIDFPYAAIQAIALRLGALLLFGIGVIGAYLGRAEFEVIGVILL